jgi:cytoskeleton protein RodZ
MTPADPAHSLDDERDAQSARPRLRVVGLDDVPAPDGPGRRLQLARIERGLSVVQVATALRLKTRHIAGMEATDFSRLPGLGYALGWVRSYADYLDLPDPAGLVAEFRARWEPVQLAGEVWRPRPKLAVTLPKSSFIAAGFGAWLVLWGAWHVIFAPKSVTDAGPPDAAIQRWANASASGVTAAPVVSTDSQTIIRALRPVKIEIRGGDGALAVSRVLQPGETLTPDGYGRWALAASDGGALEVSANGLVYVPGANGLPISNWRTPEPVIAPVVVPDGAPTDSAASAIAPAPGAASSIAPAATTSPTTTPTVAAPLVQPARANATPPRPTLNAPALRTPATASATQAASPVVRAAAPPPQKRPTATAPRPTTAPSNGASTTTATPTSVQPAPQAAQKTEPPKPASAPPSIAPATTSEAQPAG